MTLYRTKHGVTVEVDGYGHIRYGQASEGCMNRSLRNLLLEPVEEPEPPTIMDEVAALKQRVERLEALDRAHNERHVEQAMLPKERPAVFHDCNGRVIEDGQLVTATKGSKAVFRVDMVDGKPRGVCVLAGGDWEVGDSTATCLRGWDWSAAEIIHPKEG